ncbi:sperm microtubule associated protein 2 [Mixophyes fleayi]|uniref:sperm microtubule associated protein 2 n=1 Tax=Mixophyes fleayi TaxID=3061075 RepID=UPI003F4DE60D
MCAAQVSLSIERRLDLLAHHKLNLLKLRDRPSVYWQDKINIVPACSLSTRQKELAQHKTISRMYKEDRPSPIWPIKSSALLAVPSPRLEKLAQAKSISQEWMEDRPVYSIVTEASKRSIASSRTVHLAKPKNRTVLSMPGTPNSQQEDGDRCFRSEKVVASSSRTEALSVPKMEHPQYQYDLPVLRHVPASALHIQASDRVFQLANPKTRKAIFEGYDPYRISPAARHANASARIVELCIPLARKHIIRKS